jgi:hypothetical protein
MLGLTGILVGTTGAAALLTVPTCAGLDLIFSGKTGGAAKTISVIAAVCLGDDLAATVFVLMPSIADPLPASSPPATSAALVTVTALRRRRGMMRRCLPGMANLPFLATSSFARITSHAMP